jgi:hypothetical protein
MTKEELIDFLKENLKICISCDNSYCCTGSSQIKVSLTLGEEVISEYLDYVYIA